MSLVPTNRYMNAKATFGGTPIQGVKSAQYNEGIEALMEGADLDALPTVSGVTYHNPTITLRVLDAFSAQVPGFGATGALVVTVADFTNKIAATSGAKVITMTGAYLSSQGMDAEYRQLATATLSFHAVSSDGATSPVAITSL